MSITLRINGADKVAKDLKKLSDKDLNEARTRWLKESAIILEGEAKKLAPVRTGILRKNIKSAVFPTYAVVYNNLNYAEYVHEGTKPHTILPKVKKALYWKGAQHPFKVVKHPGTVANPFFLIAINKSENRLINRFNEIINEYLE